MISREQALEKITTLVERFDEQKDFYRQSDYNETLTRRDFIDPLTSQLFSGRVIFSFSICSGLDKHLLPYFAKHKTLAVM